MTSIKKISSSSNLNVTPKILAPIENLPDELVANILRNLGEQSKETRLVCKKFNWSYCQSISSAKTPEKCVDESLQLFSPNLFANLQNLAIDIRNQIPDGIPLKISRYTNLKKLDLAGIRLPKNLLSNLNLPQLLSAHISSQESEIDGKYIGRFLQSSPYLEHLELWHVAFSAIEPVNLQDLHLNLRKLTLQNIRGNVDQNLAQLFTSASKIKALKIAHSSGLNGSCFINLSQSLPCLKELSIIGNGKLHSSILMEIANPAFDCLENLYLSDESIDDGAVGRILELSPHLKELSFHSSQLTGSFFNNGSLSFPLLDSFQMIIYGAATKISSQNLGYLLNQAPTLSSLTIHNIRGNDLGNVENRLFNLTYLDLSENFLLEDQALSQITYLGPNLTSINLRSCYELTSASIDELINRCPKIEHLDLSGCDMVPNGFITNIGSRLPDLKHLNLCALALTASDFDHLVTISHLVSLDIDYSEASNTDMFQKLPLLTNLEEIVLPATARDELLLALALRMPKLRSITLSNEEDERVTSPAGIELVKEYAAEVGRELEIF